MQLERLKGLGKLTLILGSSLLLASCTNCICGKPGPFDDVIYENNYSPTIGLASGLKGTYVVYGEYPYAGVRVCAGNEIDFTGIHGYSIEELLKKYPGLDCPQAEKAAAAQKVVFGGVVDNTNPPGSHGGDVK